MIKIFISCRNRIAISTKCITALRKHSTIPHQLYIFDNLSNYKVQEHFMYFCLLYEKGIISQYTMNTEQSTFSAFSKAVSFNQFGYNHEMDPNKDKYDFLVCLDNDIIVTPGWDNIIKKAWDDVKKYKMDNIKVIGQLPGGIKSKKELHDKFGGFKAKTGVYGGSGFWTLRPDFFREIGYLDVKELVGLDKKHDQGYWKKLGKSTNGKDYILGLDVKLAIHTGKISGSICNTLTRNKKIKQRKPKELIKFEEAEKRIDSMNFDQFYEMIKKDKSLMNDW